MVRSISEWGPSRGQEAHPALGCSLINAPPPLSTYFRRNTRPSSGNSVPGLFLMHVSQGIPACSPTYKGSRVTFGRTLAVNPR